MKKSKKKTQRKPGIIKKRLALRRRKEGVPIIDRSLNFVVEGVAGSDDIAALRGPVFFVDSERQALTMFRDLQQMAVQARSGAREAEFLAGLDDEPGEDENDRRGSQRFGLFAEEWIETQLDESDRPEREVESSKSIVRLHLVPYFGRMALVDIGAREIDTYTAKKRRQKHQFGVGYSPKTINNHLSVLSRIMRKAKKYRLIEDNPMRGGDHWQQVGKTVEDSDNWLEQSDEQVVIDWLSSHWLDQPDKRLALLTQLLAGLRFSELRALMVGDLVEAPEPGIFVRRKLSARRTEAPKSKQARFQPLPREVFDDLRALAAQSVNGVLFTPPRGTHLANNTVNKWLTVACEEAGVRRVTTHGLRHTAGSSYGALGYGQKAIANLLGHVEVRSAARYVHANDKGKARALQERWAALVPKDDVRNKAQVDNGDEG